MAESEIASCPDGLQLDSSNATLVGPDVAFDRYTAHQGDELQSAKEGRSGSFSKLGIFLRRGTVLRLRVPASAPRSVRLKGWPSHRPSRVITVTHEEGTECWQGYPGGFLFNRPTCLKLEVRAGKRRAVVPFGLGKNC